MLLLSPRETSLPIHQFPQGSNMEDFSILSLLNTLSTPNVPLGEKEVPAEVTRL